MTDRDLLRCYLCFKEDRWVKAAPDPEPILGLEWWFQPSESLPDHWCHDYDDDGQTIYFCQKAHKDIYGRAKYLSWQAVSLLREFAKTFGNQ